MASAPQFLPGLWTGLKAWGADHYLSGVTVGVSGGSVSLVSPLRAGISPLSFIPLEASSCYQANLWSRMYPNKNSTDTQGQDQGEAREAPSPAGANPALKCPPGSQRLLKCCVQGTLLPSPGLGSANVTSCVTLGRLLTLSEFQLPHRYKGDINSYLEGLL